MPLATWMARYAGTPGDSLSHALLNGGVLRVSAEIEDDFRVDYAKSVVRGDRSFLAERLTPTFKFCIDADIHFVRPCTDEELVSICTICWQAVEAFYEASTAVVTKAQAEITKNDVKSSFHMIFDNVVITPSASRVLREAVVQKLMLQPSSPLEGFTDWRKAIDDAIYNGSGLRCVWSRKMTKCDTCKNGKNRSTCPECLGEGRSDKGRAHMPFCEFDGQGCASMVPAIGDPDYVLRWVRRCSLRTHESVTSQSGNPAWFEMPTARTLDNGKRARIEKTLEMMGAEGEGQLSGRRDIEELDSSVLDIVAKIVLYAVKNHMFPGDFVKCALSRPVRVTSSADPTIWVRTNSTRCLNLVKEYHSNVNVYLQVTNRTISQRCWCSCNVLEGRRFGLCSKFVSTGLLYPKKYSDALFSKDPGFRSVGAFVLKPLPPVPRSTSAVDICKECDGAAAP